MQVPLKDDKAFAKFLQTLDYPWVEETANRCTGCSAGVVRPALRL